MITKPTYRCALCSWCGPQPGSRMRLVRGVRTRVCGPCAEKREAAAEKSPGASISSRHTQ